MSADTHGLLLRREPWVELGLLVGVFAKESGCGTARCLLS